MFQKDVVKCYAQLLNEHFTLQMCLAPVLYASLLILLLALYGECSGACTNSVDALLIGGMSRNQLFYIWSKCDGTCVDSVHKNCQERCFVKATSSKQGEFSHECAQCIVDAGNRIHVDCMMMRDSCSGRDLSKPTCLPCLKTFIEPMFHTCAGVSFVNRPLR